MINGYKCLIGKLDGSAFSALAAAKDAGLSIKTDMLEKASNLSAHSKEWLANESYWTLSAMSLVTNGQTFERGQEALWAFDIDGEIYCGLGRISSVSYNGGVQAKGVRRIEIKGHGHIWSNLVLDNRWILADATWNDDGIWLDLEFWKN